MRQLSIAFSARPQLLSLLAWMAMCAALPAQAQTTPPAPAETPDSTGGAVTTLTVQSRVVEISAVVLSKSGEPQGGLTRDDFVLKQDGHDEPIRYFSQGSELPLTLALLVDTSGSQRTFIADESLASDVFFDSMLTRPQDRATLIQVDTRVLQLQSLTPSADTLHLALNRLQTSPTAGNGTRLLDAIHAVAAGPLATASGRKAIILLTDGGDNGSRTNQAEAVAEAERHNIQIYSVRYSAMAEFAIPGQPQPSSDPGLLLLQHLSETTGGRVFTVSSGSSLRSIYERIATDLRLQYEVGYTPAATLAPNSFHKLELRAHDHKLTVQARKGFFAQP